MSLSVAGRALFFMALVRPAQAPNVRLTRDQGEDQERFPVGLGCKRLGIGTAMIFPGIVAKLHRALTFLATIGNDFPRDAVSGDDFDSGDAHDERGRYFRSASDGRSARRAKSGIAPGEGALWFVFWGDDSDAFG